jgi:hypothetical protein
MKRYFNIAFFLGIILVIRGLYGFYTFFKTGCVDGSWGSRSCGPEAVITAIVIFVAGLITLLMTIRSIYLKNKTINKESNRRF